MAPDPALQLLLKSHPSHGDALGGEAPPRVTVFIDICPAPIGAEQACELLRVHGRDESNEVIRRSQADYHERFASALGAVGRA